MEMLGKIPEEGDEFVYKNLSVKVHKVENRKALESIIEVLQQEPALEK
jgi:CBS domain containing-hemolysin-like protein